MPKLIAFGVRLLQTTDNYFTLHLPRSTHKKEDFLQRWGVDQRWT